MRFAPLTADTTETCHQCHRDGVTIMAVLSSGHVGRLCPHCRTCRRFRPYASKSEFYEQPNPIVGKGPHHEQRSILSV